MTKLDAFRRLIGFLRPFMRRITLAIGLSVLTIGSGIGLMMTSAWLISMAGLQGSIATLGVAPTLVRFFGISRAVFRYLERLASHDITFRLLAKLRVWFYERIEPLSPAELEQYRSGDLVARVVSDIEELQNFFIRGIAPPLTALLVALIMTSLFFIFSPLAALALLVFLLLAGIGLPYFAWWQSQTPGQELVLARADLNARLVDTIQGLGDSLVYGYSEQLLEDFRGVNGQLAKQESRLARFEGLQTGLSVLLVNLAAWAVLIVAIPRVEGIYLATLVLGTIALFEAITPLTVAARQLGSEITAAQRLLTIVKDAEPSPELSPADSRLPTDTSLKFSHVTFRYGDHLPAVFSDFSLTVPVGERLAIVGPSGVGKSSLVNALLRFWDYDSGHIFIGDQELHTIAPSDVRRLFGVMTQRTHLFNTTIKENIRIANKQATDTEIINAAKVVHIDEFISRLPHGYDTYVGENGLALSGGERQRIALARVVLKDAPIWILDEATANLDFQTEKEVMQAVYEAAQNRTLLIITHRLPLLRDVNRVIYLAGGEDTLG